MVLLPRPAGSGQKVKSPVFSGASEPSALLLLFMHHSIQAFHRYSYGSGWDSKDSMNRVQQELHYLTATILSWTVSSQSTARLLSPQDRNDYCSPWKFWVT